MILKDAQLYCLLVADILSPDRTNWMQCCKTEFLFEVKWECTMFIHLFYHKYSMLCFEKLPFSNYIFAGWYSTIDQLQIEAREFVR